MMRFERLHRKLADDDAPHIDMAPLIDMVFILLVFFLVTTTFSTPSAVAVALPEARTSAPVEAPPAVVTVTANGELYLGSELLTRHLLTTVVGELVRTGDRRPILLEADAACPAGLLVEVIDACRSAGAEEVGIATRTVEGT